MSDRQETVCFSASQDTGQHSQVMGGVPGRKLKIEARYGSYEARIGGNQTTTWKRISGFDIIEEIAVMILL